MIRGEKVILRTVREKDVAELYVLTVDCELRGDYMPLRILPEPGFRKEFQETGFWDENRGQLLIEDREGRLLGNIFCFKVAPYMDTLEIGYQVFDVASRGKGVMTEALRLFTRYLFENRKLNRLQLTTMTANHASRKVAEKAGFRHEATLRGAVFHQGKNHDLELFSLLRTDL